jgi:hypothetical protein
MTKKSVDVGLALACRDDRTSQRGVNAALPLNELKSLYWAEIHMQEARDACLHLTKLDQAAQGKLSHCIYTGIVVTYARSFGANQGLSGMKPKFRKFPDSRMQSLHDFLLEARDAIYAHKDTKKEASRVSTAKEQDEVGKIEIHISETGTTEWEVKRSSLSGCNSYFSLPRENV